MARELIVVDWCDPCMREGNKVEAEGESFIVTIGTGYRAKPKEMMFCEVHRKEVMGPLLAEMEHAPIYKPDQAIAPTTTPQRAVGEAKPGDKPWKASKITTTPTKGAPEGYLGRVFPEAEIPKDLPYPVTEGDLQTWKCPVCNTPETEWSNLNRARPVQSLRRHMQELHPDWTPPKA